MKKINPIILYGGIGLLVYVLVTNRKRYKDKMKLNSSLFGFTTR